MNIPSMRSSLSVLALSLLLPLGACGDKSPPPANEAVQQQPLKQKIAELLKKAEAGDADAQADLGEAYASGEGLPQDAVKAADLFRQAGEKGIARAQFRLSQMYGKGEGVPADTVKAVDLLRQSAANGHAKAQAALAAMYAKGETVTRDEVLAYAWATLAMRQGEEQAKQLHDSVNLTTLLREEAEQLAAGWQRGVALARQKAGAKPANGSGKGGAGNS